MARCYQTTSHYPNHCSPRSISPYGITRLQWVNKPPGLRKGTVAMVWMVWKNGGYFHWSCGLIMQWGTRQTQSIFRPTNHKAWYRPIEGQISYTTDSPIATRLGLCSSLCWPGPRFNIKMLSYQYRKSHCGDKTVVRSSYLHNGISYTGKMTSFYWIGPLIPLPHDLWCHGM